MEILETDKLNILLVMPAFDKGGGEKLVVDLANHFQAKNHNVKLLCVFKGYTEGKVVEEQLNPLIDVVYVSQKFVKKSKRNYFGILSKLGLYFAITKWFFKNKKLFYENHITHVHLTSASFLGTLIHFFGKKVGKCKVVETYHADSSSVKGIFGLFYRVNSRFRDGLIFEVKKEDCIRFKDEHPNIPVEFIPIGADKPVSLNNITSSQFPQKEPATWTIGQVGRINIKDRRTDKYILLFKAIHQLQPAGIQFYMYGDGPDRADIENMIAKYDMKEIVKLQGYTDDMAKALSTLEIYVTINVGENCGVAGLQAIWSGIPTVAIQVDASYPDNKLDDFIPNAADLNSLAGYIVQLMNDTERQNNLKKSQLEYVKANHSIAAYCSKTEAFYKTVLSFPETNHIKA